MGEIFITNDVKRLFIAAFREIFAHDADFTYNKTDIALTKILISAKYAEPKTENLLPQLVFSTSAYNANTMSFWGNFKEEVPATGNMQSSQKIYSNIVQFQLTVDCVDNVKAECELIADKVFNSLTMTNASLFSELNMNIRAVGVGEAIPRNQYPQYQYVSSVTVQGDFMIQWTMEPNLRHPLLDSVKMQLATITI